MKPPASSEREDWFTTPEVGSAVGLSLRNTMYLCSLDLVPVVAGGTGRGKGNYRRLDCEGLARVAVTAAFYNAGVEIFLAGRLVNEIGHETQLQALSNLEALIKRPHSGTLRWMNEQNWDPDNPYYLHRALRQRTNSYVAGEALPFDRLIEIFDRTFVFLSDVPDPKEQPHQTSRPKALFKVSGWKKGADAVELTDAPPPRKGNAIPKEWARALRSYKGMTRVNASLAIRDALDAVADARRALELLSMPENGSAP